MISKLLFSTALVVASTSVLAGGAVDFALSNESLRVEHDAVLVNSGAHFSTGFIYNETLNNWALTAGFNAVDSTTANRDLVGAVGFKAMLLSSEVSDFSMGVGVGGFLRWQPDFMNGLGFEGDAYFAPSILSFGKLTSAYETVARVTYKILPQARVFIGYHDVTGNYDSQSDVEIDKTFHIGFRMSY